MDVGLATLALTLSSDYDTLVLSSGDGDFTDMFEYLSQQNKRLELAVFRNGVATELQSRADAFFWIDDFSEEVQNMRNLPPGYYGGS